MVLDFCNSFSLLSLGEYSYLSSILGFSCLTRMPRRARAERDREKYEIMVGAKKLERAESVLKII